MNAAVSSRARVLLFAGGLGIAWQGCTSETQPPALGGEGPPSTGTDAGEGFAADTGPVEPSCTVGVEGGVCVCTDQPLVLDPPTLYFVLDRSGSMNDSGKWGTVQAVIQHLVIQLGPRAKYAVAVFPDPQGDGCYPGREIFPPVQGDPPPGGNVEIAIFSTLHGISASGGTPTAATLRNLTSRITSLPGKTYVIFATDGGPNCNAAAMCDVSACTFNIEGDVGCSLTTTNCCTPTTAGPDACLDAQPSIDAVQAIATAGVPVYVLGVPESEPYASLLDQLAMVGGTARGTEPEYYAVTSNDESAFDTALAQVAAKITGSCTLTLTTVPPDPARVNVFFDGQAIGQSGPDGWSLDGTSVTLLGASCQKVLNGAVLDVRVVAGCPTVTL
jgi:hypothetical protein